jgi:hypothetical protein
MTLDHDLDRRGRQAAAGLRQRVGETALSDDAPHHSSRRPLVVVVVAVLVLVGGFALLRIGDGAPDEGGVAGTGQPTRLAFDPVPAGLAITGAFEGPLDDDFGTAISDVTLYEEPSPDGPADRLVAALSTDVEPTYLDPEVVTVDGRQVTIQDLGGGRTAHVVAPALGERTVSVITVDVPRDQATDLAVNAVIDDRGVVTVDSELLPNGMEWVALVPVGVAVPVATSFASLEGSGGIGYASGGEAQTTTVTVTTVLAQTGWLDVSVLSLRDARKLTVRGQEGIGGSWDGLDESGVISWVEPDGTLVRIEGYGHTVEELVALADDLVPLSDDEWRALVASSEDERESSGTDETATTFEGIGEPIDGEPPPLTAAEVIPLMQSFSFTQVDDTGERAQVFPRSNPDDVLDLTPADGATLTHKVAGLMVYGVVPPDTASIEIRYDDQSIKSVGWMHVAENGTFPLWFYAFGLPSYPREYQLIATGEDGSTITLTSSTDGSVPQTITTTP